MPYLPLNIPPGVAKPSTKLMAAGRWFDMNLVRWYDNVMQAWGGWSILTGARAADVGGPVQGMLAWRANDNTVRVALGTPQGAFVYHSNGTLSNITPIGFVAGQNNASGDQWGITESTSWQFDNFGEDLLGVDTKNKKIFTQVASSPGTQMTIETPGDAPSIVQAVVVTPERFVVAIGAGSDLRRVAWSDQEDYTSDGSWTAAETNQAGGFSLPGKGILLAGRRARRETLIWSEFELWSMRFVGGFGVYRFDAVGHNCGPISRRAMVVVDGRAFWMGHNSFFVYDGATRPIPSEVSDFVFSQVNRGQASKIAADVRSDFGEVIWYYPQGGGASVNTRYVSYNYVHDFWMIGALSRTDGIDRGPLDNPLAAGIGGTIYEHETGTAYVDENLTEFTPFVESGPFQIARGDNVMSITEIIPDEDMAGEVKANIIHSFFPNAAETTSPDITLTTGKTDLRITARQIRLKLTQIAAGWRVGNFRLNVTKGGLR